MVLLGQVGIRVFFAIKLLWWSSDFLSACMKWKAYEACACWVTAKCPSLILAGMCFFGNCPFLYQITLGYSKKKIRSKYVMLLFSQWTSECLFRGTPHFPLPSQQEQPSFTVTWKCAEPAESSSSFCSFLLGYTTAQSLYLLLTQFLYSKAWKLLWLEEHIIVCFWGEQRFSNSVQLWKFEGWLLASLCMKGRQADESCSIFWINVTRLRWEDLSCVWACCD